MEPFADRVEKIKEESDAELEEMANAAIRAEAEASAKRVQIGGAVIAGLVLLVATYFTGYTTAESKGTEAEQRLLKQIDSLEKVHKRLDAKHDSIVKVLMQDTKAIATTEQAVVVERNKIAQIPFDRIGIDIRIRLDSALAHPWLLDTARKSKQGGK
jgi:hypothetical protein